VAGARATRPTIPPDPRRLECVVVSTPTTPDRPDRPEDLDDPTGIRALLASLPDPGPMPARLVDRINASIAAEQEARAGTAVASLEQRRRPWRRIGLVAAAAAVAAVAVPALVTGTGPGSVLASLNGSRPSSAAAGAASGSSQLRSDASGGSAASGAESTSRAGDTGSAADKRYAAPRGAVTVYRSNTAYTARGFTAQVQAFIDHPGSPLAPLAAESPSTGPVGTPMGLQPCLDALHLEPASRVMADLGTYDGTQAVVLVVSTDTGQTAFALRRSCTAGNTSPLVGPVTLH
jgi:hypothetical protein